MCSSIFSNIAAEDEIKRFPQLEDFRDDIIANYEKRHSKPPIGAMCENDLDLLKQWHWNRSVELFPIDDLGGYLMSYIFNFPLVYNLGI